MEVVVPVESLIKLFEAAYIIDAVRKPDFELTITKNGIYIDYYYSQVVSDVKILETGRIISEEYVSLKTGYNYRIELRFPIVLCLNLLKKIAKNSALVKIQIPYHKVDIKCFDPKELFIPA